jgi:translation initiation factor IF-2
VDNSGSQAAPVASRGAQGTRGRGGRGRAATPKRENDGVDKIAGDRRQPARRGRGGRGGRGGSGTAATTPAGSGAPAVAVRATPAEASH